MSVQTDLRGGGYGNCSKCGALIYWQNNVAFNVNIVGVQFGSTHQEAENEDNSNG
jgi:hypothetical protein